MAVSAAIPVALIAGSVGAFIGKKLANKLVMKKAQGVLRGVSKPVQNHHVITIYGIPSKQASNITNIYGLSLNDSWNIVAIEHLGRHTKAYHDFIFSKLSRIHKIANGDQAIFLREFKNVSLMVKNNPAMVSKGFNWDAFLRI